MRRRLLVGGVVLALAAGGLVAFLAWPSEVPPGALAVEGVLHVNVNCSDFERSRAFYERLGFRVLMDVMPRGEGDVARAVGLEPSYELRGALLVHRDGFVLDLLEWKAPRDDAAPYERLNHLGLARLALQTSDLDGDVAKLRAAGTPFLSERPGAVPDGLGGTTRFIAFRDPDGTVLELVEMSPPMRAAKRASKAVPLP